MAEFTRETVVLGIKTTVCVLAMFNAGMNAGIAGPMLPDLQYHTDSSTTEISTLFVLAGLGCALGALGGSPLFDRYNGFLCLAVTLALEAVFFTTAPICPNLAGVSVAFAFGSVFNYAILSGTFAMAMKLWRARPEMVSPVIQGIDLMHAFGLAVIPLAAQPFLGDYRNITFATNSTLTMTMARTDNVISPAKNPMLNDMAKGITVNSTDQGKESFFLGFGMNFQTAFIILGFFTIGCALFSLIGYALREQETDRQFGQVKYETLDMTETPGDGFSWNYHMTHNKSLFVTFIVSGFLFFVANGGRDVTMAGLLYVYVTQYLSFSPESGTLLVFVYHMIRTLGHLVIILGARWLRPLYVGIADLILILAAAVALILTVDIYPNSIWICSCVTALATSNIYPTTLSLVEEAVAVTGRISGVLFCGMAVGQMAFSFFAGNMLDAYGTKGVPLALLTSAVCCVVLFVPLALVTRRLNKLVGSPLIMETEVDIEKEREHPRETTPLLIPWMKERGRSASLFVEYGPRATPPIF